MPRLPGMGGDSSGGKRPKEKGEGDSERGTETQREDRHEGWGEKYKKIVRKASRDLKGIKVGMDSFLKQRLLCFWSVPDGALSPGGGPAHQTRSPHSESSETGELRDRDQRQKAGEQGKSHSTDGAGTGLRVRPRGGQVVAGGGPGRVVTASLGLPTASAPLAGPGRVPPPQCCGAAWRWRTTRPSGSAHGCWLPSSAATG